MQDDSKQRWADVISSIAQRVVTVGNLDMDSTSTEDVLSFSSPYGKVEDVQFWKSRRQGRSFVFITYSTKHQAAAAISQLSCCETVFTGSDGKPLRFRQPPSVRLALLNSLEGNYDREVAYRLTSQAHINRHASPTTTLDDAELQVQVQPTASGSQALPIRRHAPSISLSLGEQIGIKPDPEAIDAFIASALILPGSNPDVDPSLSPQVTETVLVGGESPRSVNNSSTKLKPASLPAVLPPKEPIAMRSRLGAFAHPAIACRRESSDISLGFSQGETIAGEDADWKSMCKQAELRAAEFKQKWEAAEQQANDLKYALEKAQTTSEIVSDINAEDILKLQDALEAETRQRNAITLELDLELRRRKRSDGLLAETEEDVRRLRHQLENEHRLHLADMEAIRLKDATRATEREGRILADVERLRRQVTSKSQVTKNLEAKLARNRNWRNDMRQELKDMRESRGALLKERDVALEREQALSQEVKRLHAVVEVAKQIEDLVAKARQRVADSKAESEAAQEANTITDLSTAI
ncbi:hypothetical protein FRB98_008987 [Tulasnella sp. 332]|nr:hypothetical protein FRB98_008987 [Tulasnella sp. 332]